MNKLGGGDAANTQQLATKIIQNDETSSSFFSSLKENPYFSAGFGLVGIGALLSILKKTTAVTYALMLKRNTISMEMVSRDPSYEWLLRMINNHLKETSQHLSVQTQIQRVQANETKRVSTSFSFLPSIGIHYFRYKGYWIRAERSRDSTVDRHTGFPVETLKLQTIGRNRDLFISMLLESRQKALQEQVGKTMVYTALGKDWKAFGHPSLKRPLDSVVLDQGISQTLYNDVKDFLNNSKWYQDRGIPYRRGYLLYGPPGCGKTSFIKALAGAFDYDIAVANLSDISISDDSINALFSNAPEQSIILIEDIDAAFRSREHIDKNPTIYEGIAKLTLSGLLNALDGVSASDGRIIFMTTNYVDRLDPALIRPGRVDVRQYVGYLNEYQIYKMFINFYPNSNEEKAKLFAKRVCGLNKNFSAAQVQGYFMLCKNEPDKAIESIDLFFAKI